MTTRQRAACWLIAVAALAAPAGNAALATPPAYLVLRGQESPGKYHHPGHADAALYDARASGYAYGWFGAAPRSHGSRHFGYYRTFTQWSFY
jgi:hypothetical protein